MRNATYVRQDTEHVLEARHQESIGLITAHIEQACQTGKFQAIISFGKVIDQPTQSYIRTQLKEKGYKANFNNYSTQRDGTVLEVSW